MSRLVFLTGLAISVSACGLIDSDITDFSLRLPEKDITVDTAQWQLTQDTSMPAVPCSGNEGVCSAGVSEFCNFEKCYGTCDGQNCEVTVLVELWNEFNLGEEAKELELIDEKPLATVTIDRIHFQITENTFNVTSPELTVYVAPQGVMDTGSPQAEAIGTIRAIEAQEIVDAEDVELSADGDGILRRYMTDYTTPFNILIGSEVVLSANDPIPTGKLTAIVKVDAHASAGL